MSIASQRDWTGLRAVGRIVRLTLEALEARVRPGVSTAELDDVARAMLAAHGARSAPAITYGFPGTVLISLNAEIVHGVPGSRRLERGDVVKLDVTAEKDGYMADAARTVLVEGASDEAKRLRACALTAFDGAMKVARAGVLVREIGRAVESEVRRQGFSIIRALAGHGIGRTIHEPPSVPNYPDPQQHDVLTEGLVIAVEPMITTGSGDVVEDADGWTIRTADGGLGAHYEQTIVITRGRPVLLTAA